MTVLQIPPLPDCGIDQHPFVCPCAGNAKAAGGIERAQWQVAVAGARCDRDFPLRLRHAKLEFGPSDNVFHDTTSDPDILGWVGYEPRPSNRVLGRSDDWSSGHLDQIPSLLILGATGVGKTWQAYGCLRFLAEQYGFNQWTATSYAEFTAAMRPSGKDPEGTLSTYREVPLLLMDDLGAARISEFTEETTYRLIDARYSDMRPSIFTSNLTPQELSESLGGRIASRLQGMCRVVVLKGDDRRRHGVTR